MINDHLLIPIEDFSPNIHQLEKYIHTHTLKKPNNDGQLYIVEL